MWEVRQKNFLYKAEETNPIILHSLLKHQMVLYILVLPAYGDGDILLFL